MIGKTRWEYLGRRLAEPFWQAQRAAIAAHRPFRDSKYVTAKARGAGQPLCVYGQPIFAEDGQFLGYLGTQDVTRCARRKPRRARERERFANSRSGLEVLWGTARHRSRVLARAIFRMNNARNVYRQDAVGVGQRHPAGRSGRPHIGIASAQEDPNSSIRPPTKRRLRALSGASTPTHLRSAGRVRGYCGGLAKLHRSEARRFGEARAKEERFRGLRRHVGLLGETDAQASLHYLSPVSEGCSARAGRDDPGAQRAGAGAPSVRSQRGRHIRRFQRRAAHSADSSIQPLQRTAAFSICDSAGGRILPRRIRPGLSRHVTDVAAARRRPEAAEGPRAITHHHRDRQRGVWIVDAEALERVS